MTEIVSSQIPDRELRGCPVMHRDFSPAREFGSHWQEAEELRESSPVYFNTFAQGYWVFTRHDAVRDMYKDHALFSSESITPWQPDPVYRFIPTQIDGPDHLTYRRILNPWFAPPAMEAAEPLVRRICSELVAELAAQGRCDFMTEFALRFPTEVFLAVIGVPRSDADRFVAWVEDFFAGFGGDLDKVEPMTRALEEIREYWVVALAERKDDSEPRPGDLASHLMHATFDGRPLNDNELLDMLTVLVLAGLDTTRGQLGYLFKHLAEHPEHRQRLIDDPSLTPLAVEEALRYYTIIFGEGRKVTRDTEFHGAALKRGDMVYGLVSAANRDPRAYEQADEFVLDRKRNNHMGFANGPHRCLGMHLARREMAVAVNEWLKQIPDFEVATDEVLSERGGGAMLTLAQLPLRWDT